MKVVTLDIKQKTVSGRYLNQNFVVQHDRYASEDKRWMYEVSFTRTYRYVGNAPTQAMAERKARNEIRRLTRANEVMEEEEVERGE